MAIDQVKDYFRSLGREQDILEFSVSSATVELAAQALGTEPARIAKTLSFYDPSEDPSGEHTFGDHDLWEHAILVVTAGDQKIDKSKFKHFFGKKARMLAAQDVERLTGHPVGGVCPFANPPHTRVYLDISLKRFPTVFPAAGSPSSAVQLTCEELMDYSRAVDWIDVCRQAL